MKLQKYGTVMLATMLLLCGCQENSDADTAKQSAITATYDAETFEKGYADCIVAYFDALQSQDYAAYEQTVYAPYAEAYSAYLEGKGKTLEASFTGLASQFDEDGYASWEFTEIQMNYYAQEDPDDFFETWVKLGIFDEQFVADCKTEAIAIHDVEFTLYALYEGDSQAVPVVQGGEMMMIQTEQGYYLFG